MQVNGKLFSVEHDNRDMVPFKLFNKNGIMPSQSLNIWIEEVIADNLGIYMIDWLAAKFKTRPFFVHICAITPEVTNPYDRPWASMVNGWNATMGKAYALRGAMISSAVLVGGGGASVRIAPGLPATVIAIGT